MGAKRQATIDFWEGVLGMPFVFEQPNLCNRHGLEWFYPTDPAERAMVESAIADIRLAATLEFLRAVDYEFPA